jgi:hypothetical protein
MAAVAMRGMICPPELEGKPTGNWLSSNTSQARGNWKLYEDRLIRM